MSITTTSILPPPIKASFDFKLLAVPTPTMIHNIPAMRSIHPRNGGDIHRFRRYNPLNTALVPLGPSGMTPPGQNLTAVDRHYVHDKFSLIDLETYCNNYGDKAQA